MTGSTSGQFADPKKIITHFHLHEGDIVADFGAGSGHYLEPLSRVVGDSGKVYACEIQKNLVDSLGYMARTVHLTNVFPLWCDVEAPGGTKLDDASLDCVLISNMAFQAQDKISLFSEARRVLHKGGKLCIIDWTDSFNGLGPHPQHVYTEEKVRRDGGSVGLVYERSFPAGEHHYGVILRAQ